ERQRHVHGEVATVTTEQRVRTHVHDDIQVAGRTTVAARATTTLHADALAVVDTGGDAHLHLTRAHLDAAAVARGARGDDDLSAPTAVRAHLRERERTLVDRDLTAASALRAALRMRAGTRAVAVTRLAHRVGAEPHGARDPAHRVDEAQVQLGLEVLSA